MTAPVSTEKGRQCFAVMFSRWIDSNEWTYNQLCQFARSIIGDSWMHPSQVSGLRQAKLEGPNPKVFAAIWEVNQALVRWEKEEVRPSGGVPAEYYENPIVWTNDAGEPLNIHELITMFLGYWEPAAYKPLLIPTEDAERVSRALGRLIRITMSTQGEDIIEGWENWVRCYAPLDVVRRTKLQKVVVGLEFYSPEELAIELPVIAEAFQQYTGVVWTSTELAERLSILPNVPASGKHPAPALPN